MTNKNKVRDFLNNNKFMLAVVVGLLVIGSSVWAAGGLIFNVQNVENVNIAGDSSESAVLGSAEMPDCATNGHIGGCPSTWGNGYFEGAVEIDGVLYTDGGINSSGALTFTGEAQLAQTTLGGGVVELGTTGSVSSTMTAANFCDYSFIVVTTTVTTTAPNLQLPSTSTLFADCLGSNGKSHSVMLYNSSSTAAVATIYAGSGMTLIGFASSTASSQDTWDGGDYKKLECIRYTANNVVCSLATARDAD